MTDEPAPASETIAEGFDRVDEATARASGLIRTLALSGIATVWLTVVGTGNVPTTQFRSVTAWLLWAVVFCALSLATDVFQYVAGSAALVNYLRDEREKAGGNLNAQIPRPPTKVRAWGSVPFYAKGVLALAGWGCFAVGFWVAYIR